MAADSGRQPVSASLRLRSPQVSNAKQGAAEHRKPVDVHQRSKSGTIAMTNRQFISLRQHSVEEHHGWTDPFT